MQCDNITEFVMLLSGHFCYKLQWPLALLAITFDVIIADLRLAIRLCLTIPYIYSELKPHA